MAIKTTMTEAEREAAARTDPDNLPLTKADFARMKRVPRVKILREALKLTQEEFAARFHIPIGTLRDWEQNRKPPDQTARAYLTVVARDPEGIRRLLEQENVRSRLPTAGRRGGVP
jgi:putative transcriptional regulator